MNETIIKKWGNSAAIVIPAEILKEKHLKIGDEIVVTVARKVDLRSVFGALKRKPGLSGQAFKDLAKEGWGD